MNYTKIRNPLMVVTAILLTSQFAAADDELATQEEAEAERVCFYSDRVRNFDGLTDNFLYVEVNRSEMYLLSMRSRCFNLRTAKIIAFKNTINRVCSNDNFIEIIVRDMGRTSSCRADNIERVESKEEAKAIAEDREAAKQAERE